MEYSSQIVANRSDIAPQLLIAGEVSGGNSQLDGIQPECLLDYNTIADCMKEAGKDIMGMIPLQVSRLNKNTNNA